MSAEAGGTVGTVEQAPAIDLGGLLTSAVQHHQAGDLASAEQTYRRVLELQPDQPDALHLLGVLAHQVGQHEVAVELIGRAIQAQPGVPDFHAHLGSALQALGRLAEAADAYQHAVELQPGHLMALNNLGNVRYRLGRLDEAVGSYRQGLAIHPDLADAHLNLSAVLKLQRKLEEALAHADRALALAPTDPAAHNNRGVILHELGRYDEALASYQQVLALAPENDGTYVNLGNTLYALHRLDETVAVLQHAIALRPDDPSPCATLSNALCDLGLLDEAVAACHAGLALDPASFELRVNLGNALHVLGRLDEAIAELQHAIALRPDDAVPYATLSTALRDLGRLDAALAACRQGLALDPDCVGLHSNLIFALDLTPGAGAEAWEERRRWNERHAAPLAAVSPPHANQRDPERRLRIGYVSADFRRHSAAYAILPILEAHDATRVEVTCYHNSTTYDAYTERFQAAAQRWRPISPLTDAQLAEQVRADGIDILVDLSGHSRGNRLLTFARRPAPVQVSAWGYASSTGVEAIDYIFADAVSVPLEARRWYCEEVIDLPAVLTYQPPAIAPDVAPLPALTRGVVTFGSFNRPTKLSDDALLLWARVLRAAPNARLLLKFAGLETPVVRDRILGVLAGAGVEPGRVELRGGTPQLEHLAAYGEIDIVLDPIPQSGGITILEGLWMGVPAVTLLGESIAGRIAGSLLHATGLPELVASTPEAYVETAIRLTEDLPRLAAQRAGLRAQLGGSPVCNPRLFAAAVEDAYQDMWRRWCAEARERP